MTSNQVVPDVHAEDVTYHAHHHHRKTHHNDGHSYNTKHRNHDTKSKRRRQHRHSTKHKILKTVDVESLFTNSSNKNITTNMAISLDNDIKLANVEVKDGKVEVCSSDLAILSLSDPVNVLSNSQNSIDVCSSSNVLLNEDAGADHARKRWHDTNLKQHEMSQYSTTQSAPAYQERDQETITMLDKYIESCQVNYGKIESQIDSMFSTLLSSLKRRQEVLIEEAKLIRDRKIKSLTELKDKCLDSQNNSITKGHPLIGVEHKNILNGQSETSVNQVQSDEKLICINFQESKDNRNSVNADEHFTADNFVDLGRFEEGNMTFNYKEEEIHFISNFGDIQENLSSPQFSSTKGLDDSCGIIGEKVHFEVHTRNISGEMNWNPMDKIEIRVCDSNKNNVNVDQTSSLADYKRLLFNEDTYSGMETSNNGVYSYSFLPLRPGAHDILVKLNDIEISTSPFTFIAYPKLNLTFAAASNALEASQFSNDSSSDEAELYPNTLDIPGRDWIVQKDGKSILLRSLSDQPSHIYGSEIVDEMCAWQIRVTTACMNIVLSIGIKTRSGIPDLDEQFTCDFHLKTFVGTSSALDKANHAKCSFKRQVSSFTRLSWTFTVLLNNGILRVTCDELNEDRRIRIGFVGALTLHPFCSMIHHHNDIMYMSCLCPSPQLTLL